MHRRQETLRYVLVEYVYDFSCVWYSDQDTYTWILNHVLFYCCISHYPYPLPLSVSTCTFIVKTSLLEIYSSIYCRVGWTPIVYKSDIQHCESVPNFCFVFRKRHQQHKVRKRLPIYGFLFWCSSFLIEVRQIQLIYYSNSNPWLINLKGSLVFDAKL